MVSVTPSAFSQFSQFACNGSATQVGARTNGETERVADFIVTCTGGAPTPAGIGVPTFDISLFFSAPVTSRPMVQGWSEALLLIDEPGPSNQLACTTPSGICSMTGTNTGASTYNGSQGRFNIFQGRQVEPNLLVWSSIPIDFPGTGVRRFRFTNLRVDPAQSGPILAAVGISQVQVSNATQTLATALTGFSTAARDTQNIGGRLGAFTVRIVEGFASAFKSRTVAGTAAANQNTPGALPLGTETGFRNSALPDISQRGNLGDAGLADTGTRVRIRINNVSSLMTITAPLTLGNGLAQLMEPSNVEGTGTFVPAKSTTLPNSNGTVYAFYEIAQTASDVVESLDIPFGIAYGNGAPQVMQLSGDVAFAPVDTTQGTIPRFTGVSVFQATAPAFPVSITTSSLPNGAVGTAYQQTVQATGGTPPYSFSFAAPGPNSNPPPGLAMQSNGVLSGIPTVFGTYTFTVVVEDASKARATQAYTVNISPGAPPLQLSKRSLEFEAAIGGPAPPAQSVALLSSSPSPVQFRIEVLGPPGTTGAPAWIQVKPPVGVTPAQLVIAINHAGLAEGTYTARIRILPLSPGAQVVLDEIPVTLKVITRPPLLTGPCNPSDPNQCRVLRFRRRALDPGTALQSFGLRNSGGGAAIPFTVTFERSSPWIRVVQPVSTQAGGTPVTVQIEVNSNGLPEGFFHEVVRVTWSGGVIRIPAVLYVAPQAPLMEVNTTGVRFLFRAGEVSPEIKTIRVLNRTPNTTINWTAEIIRGDEWLALVQRSGTAAVDSPGLLRLALKPAAANTAPGSRYALVRITDPRAVSSPQYVVAVLQILAAADGAPLLFEDSGVILSGAAGARTLTSQGIALRTSSSQPVPFAASAIADDGGDWLFTKDTAGSVTSQGTQITVSADTSNLQPGIYEGKLVISASGKLYTISLTLIVVPPLEGDRSARAACAPSKLALVNTSLVNNFSVPAGWPATLIVELRNDCNAAVADATVVANFSNGDPPVTLTPDSSGSLYSATWQPGFTVPEMNVSIEALAPGMERATAVLIGGVTENKPPTLTRNGTIHNLNPALGGSLSPGVVAQVYGTGLAGTAESTGVVPLATTYKGTTVFLAGFEAPLYYVSPGQLVVQFPIELTPNRPYPIVVSANNELTVPDLVTIVPVQPGVAAFLDGKLIAQHTDYSLVTDQNPARRGELLVMYLVGLGETNPPVPTGTAAPGTPLAFPTTQAVVTVDGKPAEVVFSGMTPSGVGLFQINFYIPTDARLNTPVDVVVTQGGIVSNTTKLTIVQ